KKGVVAQAGRACASSSSRPTRRRRDLGTLGWSMGIKSGFTLGNLVFFWMLSCVKGKDAGRASRGEREGERAFGGGVMFLSFFLFLFLLKSSSVICDRKCNLLAKAGVQCSD
uniref:Uncharacterized protein n=1 Tax=Salvator merianae TaxID=96440 RepID=A0A8D0E8T1_SALMN